MSYTIICVKKAKFDVIKILMWAKSDLNLFFITTLEYAACWIR